eukprot:4994439-Amphidinium_carterae.1
MPEVFKPACLNALAVLVTDEKHELARDAASWAQQFSVAECEMAWNPEPLTGSIKEMPLAGLAPQDRAYMHVCRATVTTGQFKDLCAVGAGTNKVRIQRGTSLALAISAALRLSHAT